MRDKKDSLQDLEQGELPEDVMSIFLDLLHRTRLGRKRSSVTLFEPNDLSHEYTMMLIDQEIFGTSSGLLK